MKQDRGATPRRDFLKLAGVGSVASAAAVVVGTTAEAKTEPDQSGTGYRETAHVKKVYELARF